MRYEAVYKNDYEEARELLDPFLARDTTALQVRESILRIDWWWLQCKRLEGFFWFFGAAWPGKEWDGMLRLSEK